MEREAMFDSVNLPPREVPSQQMVGVKNPFLLKLKISSADQRGNSTSPGVIEFLLSTTAPCYVTFYWEVKKTAIDAALCEEDKQRSSSFDDDEDDSNDSDLDEAPSMSVIPLEHILQGSYKYRSASEFYDSGSDMEISVVPPSDLEYKSPTSSHSASTSSLNYALVVTVEMSRRDELGPQQLSDIVALITAIDISNSSAGKCANRIATQCVQTAGGKIYSMKKLFVVETDDDNTETQASPSTQATPSSSSPEDSNSPPLSSDLINAVCIICRALPVTRAFLPCRHACVCGLCFKRLHYCPMCRGVIQSYFKVQDEPFIVEDESNTSTELKNMSVGEIIRGVFSAS